MHGTGTTQGLTAVRLLVPWCVAQGQNLWCSAAVAVSVEAHYRTGTARAQCQVIQALCAPSLPAGTCCGDPTHVSCTGPVDLAEAVRYVGRFHSEALAPLSRAQLHAELAGSRPVCGILDPLTGGLGHAVMMFAFNPAKDEVQFFDPYLRGTETVSYQSLVRGSKIRGIWRRTVLTA